MEDNTRRFVRVRRGISDSRDVADLAVRLSASAIFFTPIEWLDPTHLRQSSGRVRDCMLTSPLYFDIDVKSPQTITAAATTVHALMETIRKLSNRDPDMLVFSGKSGFHVYYWNWDDIPSRYPHPEMRIMRFRESRMQLLSLLRQKGVAVDWTVTPDPWRVMRLPGSLHWDTGLVACVVSELDEFRQERDAVAFPPELYEEVFGPRLPISEVR
jgi:DNA primase catalytic subunit